MWLAEEWRRKRQLPVSFACHDSGLNSVNHGQILLEYGKNLSQFSHRLANRENTGNIIQFCSFLPLPLECHDFHRNTVTQHKSMCQNPRRQMKYNIVFPLIPFGSLQVKWFCLRGCIHITFALRGGGGSNLFTTPYKRTRGWRGSSIALFART